MPPLLRCPQEFIHSDFHSSRSLRLVRSSRYSSFSSSMRFSRSSRSFAAVAHDSSLLQSRMRNSSASGRLYRTCPLQSRRRQHLRLWTLRLIPRPTRRRSTQTTRRLSRQKTTRSRRSEFSRSSDFVEYTRMPLCSVRWGCPSLSTSVRLTPAGGGRNIPFESGLKVHDIKARGTPRVTV
jgi:hypothetical protein